MLHPAELRIEDFTYQLPQERIALHPLDERDASKLLVYSGGQITDDHYRNIAAYVPEGTLMVFNQTRVVHARLLFRKPTGGQIEVFCLSPAPGAGDVQTAMQQHGHVEWECLVGGADKWKPGMTLQLHCDAPAFTLSATIAGRSATAFILRLEWDKPELSFAEVLLHLGKVPLPPYINRIADGADAERYQTIFAREEGSVAAPTAGLHFTGAVLQQLAARQVEQLYVTLHVGAGTFKPVKAATMHEHDMHAEWITITAAAVARLQAAVAAGRPILPVGTTSLRTIESLYWIGNALAAGQVPAFGQVAVEQWQPYETRVQATPAAALQALAGYMSSNGLAGITTQTRILIAPGYDFKLASGLVTNFHQPQSTLLLLVAAMVGSGWRTLYDHALAHGYRFLSYGDGSLLWRS